MTEGYINAVKTAMIAHVAAADSELSPAATHVLPSSENDIWDMDTDNLPIVTIRVGPATTLDELYGRILKGKTTIKKGTYVMVFFTAHVHDDVPSSGDKAENAMNTAELIKTKLLKSDDPTTSGIVHYERITLREAPLKMHGVARVIMEGYILVRRPH